MSFWFMTENFFDSDVYNTFSYSSQQSAFPATNVLSGSRRSKLWRTNGYWNVESGSNTIVFRETALTNLTATITAAEYTSTSSLLTAIKTALEATGASTYTVATDVTTGKIKITSDGLGGGGIFELIWTDPGSADMASLLGFDSSFDQSGALTYTAQELKISNGEWLKLDLGISSNPTSVVLIGPRNEPLRITPSATIKIQGNETDVWDDPSYEADLEYNESSIALFSDSGLHTEPLRYWRILFEDTGNPVGYIEIGAVFLGEHYATTRGQPQFPFTIQEIDRSTTLFSEAGQTFSNQRPKAQRFQSEWFALTKEEYEAIQEIFSRVGTSVPFFILFDPETVFSTINNKTLKYVKFESEPQAQLVRPNVFTMSMTFREEL